MYGLTVNLKSPHILKHPSTLTTTTIGDANEIPVIAGSTSFKNHSLTNLEISFPTVGCSV